MDDHPLKSPGYLLVAGVASCLVSFSCMALAEGRLDPPAAGNAGDGGGSSGPAQLPSFELADIKGGRVSLSEHTGKVVVVVFWSTWCQPCKKELSILDGLLDKYKDQGFVGCITTISADFPC